MIDTKALGENTIVIDCDVLQADGGTRTASITGAYVALVDAIEDAKAKGLIAKTASPLVGLDRRGERRRRGWLAGLDLDYPEDSTADTDMNVVMTGSGKYVEVQGTAEGADAAFDRDRLNELLDLAAAGCAALDREAAAGTRRGAAGADAVTRLVLATQNEHKVHELRQILAELVDELGLEIVGASDFPDAPDVVESEVTFEGNARLKAVAVAKATGLPSVADDSGLAVDVLGGSPGGLLGTVVWHARRRRCAPSRA